MRCEDSSDDEDNADDAGNSGPTSAVDDRHDGDTTAARTVTTIPAGPDIVEGIMARLLPDQGQDVRSRRSEETEQRGHRLA